MAGGAAAGAAIGAGVMAMRSSSQDDYSRSQSYDSSSQMQIGQAVEMDAHTGSMPNENYGLTQNDTDVNGMVGLQQGLAVDNTPVEARSPTSVYSEHQ